MKIQDLKFKIQNKIHNLRFKIQSCKVIFLLLCCYTALLLLFNIQPSAFASEKWSGVDETVVEKYAKEHGREAMEPLINTDQGDMLLFVFLIAGAISGFIAGYYWRTLTLNKGESMAGKNR